MNKIIKILILTLFILMQLNIVSACVAKNAQNIIYVQNCTNLNDLNESLNNATALNLTSNILNANLRINASEIFYINDTILKINSTNSKNTTAFNISSYGYLYITNSNISSWNVTTGATAILNSSNPAYGDIGRGYISVQGNASRLEIRDSKFYGLGHYCSGNACLTEGISYLDSDNGLVLNNSFYNDYAHVWAQYSTGHNITGNYFDTIYSRSVLSYWSGGESKNFTFNNNVVNYTPLSFFTTWEAVYLNGDNNIISNNNITVYGSISTVQALRVGTPASNNTVFNNTVKSYGGGFQINGGDSVIYNNTFNSSYSNTLLISGSTAKNNTFTNDQCIKTAGTGAGVSIESSADNNTFYNVSIDAYASYRALSVSAGSNNRFNNGSIRNRLAASTANGLYLTTGITRYYVNNSIINASGASGYGLYDTIGGSYFNNSIINGSGTDIFINAGTDYFMDVLVNRSKINISGTGIINVSYLVSVESDNDFSLWVYGNGSLLFSGSSVNNIISKIPIPYFTKNPTTWTNYTPHSFYVESLELNEYYQIIKNGIINATLLLSSSTGNITYYDTINDKDILIDINIYEDSISNLTGIVKTEFGENLTNVRVAIAGQTQYIPLNEFNFTNIPNGVYVLTVNAENYKEYSITIDLSQDLYYSIYMEKSTNKNYELLIIFILCLIVIEILEYEKSSLHSLIITISSILVYIELDNILTVTGVSLFSAYTMVALIPVMGCYRMILLHNRRRVDPDEFL